MAKKERRAAKSGKTVSKKSNSRTRGFAESGVYDGLGFANVMSALMSDLLLGNIAPDVGNATCNAGGKLLKIVEMQHKYGRGKPLRLAGPPTA
jgi:hypothetical protein